MNKNSRLPVDSLRFIFLAILVSHIFRITWQCDFDKINFSRERDTSISTEGPFLGCCYVIRVAINGMNCSGVSILYFFINTVNYICDQDLVGTV